MEDIAIRVNNISKCYPIYNKPKDRLKQALYPRLQRILRQPEKQYYREFWALKDVSFEVKKGETVGIIGRNGSGKSTLLQMICGTLNPTTGSIETKGRIAALLELGSGFNPEFTGRENVYMNASILGLSRAEIDARYDEIVSFADIGDFINQPVKTYSSGMVVRLAFAVQAMVDPDILIVDEALAVGDEKFQRKCFSRLEDLKDSGTVILFVSHSVTQIVELCERALLLERGERLLYGKPQNVVRAYQKMIYSPEEHRMIMIREYKAFDCATTDFAIKSANLSSEIRANEIDEEILSSFNYDNAQNDNKAYFDPGLFPDTTTVYPIQGGEILSICIIDMAGHMVNCLSFGEEYDFKVSGRFLSDRVNVFLGIHIRTISGLTLTGQRYPNEGEYIEAARAGSCFSIRYRFKMLLAPGIYFCGGGIWAIDEPTCLHRIVDAIMFRVISHQKTNILAHVDMSSAEPVFEIS